MISLSLLGLLVLVWGWLDGVWDGSSVGGQ